MPKRTAENQLTSDNFNQQPTDDGDDNAGGAGFPEADPETIAKRRIVKAKRRLPKKKAVGDDESKPNPFAGVKLAGQGASFGKVPEFKFGASTEGASKSVFSEALGVKPAEVSPVQAASFSIPSKGGASASAFKFGGSSTPATPFGANSATQTKTSPKVGFAFGQSKTDDDKTTTTTKPTTTTTTTKPTFNFGSFNKEKTTSDDVASGDQPAKKKKFAFGGASTGDEKKKPLFNFGSLPTKAPESKDDDKKQDNDDKKQDNDDKKQDDTSTKKPLFAGLVKPKDDTAKSTETSGNKPVFTFGKTAPKLSPLSPEAASAKPFQFGVSKTTSTTTDTSSTDKKPTPKFSFGDKSSTSGTGAFQFKLPTANKPTETTSSSTTTTTTTTNTTSASNTEDTVEEPVEPTVVKGTELPEGHEIKLEVRCKMFEMGEKEDDAGNTTKSWINKGIAIVKLIVAPGLAYIVARSEGVGRLLLNARLFPQLKVTRPKPTMTQFVVIDNEGTSRNLMLKVAAADEAAKLQNALDTHKTGQSNADTNATTTTDVAVEEKKPVEEKSTETQDDAKNTEEKAAKPDDAVVPEAKKTEEKPVETQAKSTPFKFGVSKSDDKAASAPVEPKKFTFGGAKGDSGASETKKPPTFSFGASKPSEAGAAKKTPTPFVFGKSTDAEPAKKEPAKKAAPVFKFGASASNKDDANKDTSKDTSKATPKFVFGAASTDKAATEAKKPAFSFGAAGKTSMSSTPSAATPASSSSDASQWPCAACGTDNSNDATQCSECWTKRVVNKPKTSSGFSFGGLKPSTAAATSSSSSDKWKCAACTTENEASATSCNACLSKRVVDKPKSGFSFGGLKPSTTAATSSSSSSTTASDKWKCAACTTENDASATSCNACLSKRVVDKPKSGFTFGGLKPTTTPASTDATNNTAATSTSSKWKCAACTSENDDAAQSCSVCLAKRRVTKPTSSAATNAADTTTQTNATKSTPTVSKVNTTPASQPSKVSPRGKSIALLLEQYPTLQAINSAKELSNKQKKKLRKALARNQPKKDNVTGNKRANTTSPSTTPTPSSPSSSAAAAATPTVSQAKKRRAIGSAHTPVVTPTSRQTGEANTFKTPSSTVSQPASFAKAPEQRLSFAGLTGTPSATTPKTTESPFRFGTSLASPLTPTASNTPKQPATPLTPTSSNAMVAQLAQQLADASPEVRAELAAESRRLLSLCRAIATDDRDQAVRVIELWRVDNKPLCEYVRRKRGQLSDSYHRLLKVVVSPPLRALAQIAQRTKADDYVHVVEQFAQIIAK